MASTAAPVSRLQDAQLELQGFEPLDQGILDLHDSGRLLNLGDHQQQDHGTKPAADAIQEGQASRLEFAAFAAGHQGQSAAGLMNEP